MAALPGSGPFDQLTCANPLCKFVLVMGVTAQCMPQKCPKCGGKAWDVVGSIDYCPVTKAEHKWRFPICADTDKIKDCKCGGVYGTGSCMFPFRSGNVCQACGAVPVEELAQ